MSNSHTSDNHDEPEYYTIRIKGHLDGRWAEWFEGLTITLEANGETLLAGPVADQAALHGLLKKVRDLGLPLIAVGQLDARQTLSPDDNTDTDQHRSHKETKP